ncbi:hypothetical protein P152DRAFT_459764 [Eremomyces bilateralis CBS 781.70]|uniref:Rhodopsin domain-containing protein n=1 Tax=Eremomyces bilateralis CBS 781.70 TaxID=1392243 RepID=A0A6G1FZT0_9PEZI|nr:uncharacterized protein P152DRAFT_459764 [Eremomyces bilateralis CBS 781.70]KAF1811365.1 hypothetical protein P152DRAFT_459764 [Eremomyces bilateralis CBS 781.70]
MILPPTEILLKWPPPDYETPETRGSSLLVASSIFTAFAAVAVALRLYARIFITRWFGIDDVLICFALLFTIGTNVTVDLGISKYGWNRHTWDVPIEWIDGSLKLAYATKILFLIAANATMVSLLAFYYRLITDVNIRWFRLALSSSIAFNLICWIVFLVLQIVPCIPISAFWKVSTEAPCADEGTVLVAGGVVKTFIDVLVTTLPIPLILSMKLRPQQRYGLVVLLALGYIVTAAGALRTYYTWKVFHNPLWDYSWYYYPAFLASAVENDLAVICACVPAMRPLLRPIFGPFGGMLSKVHSFWKTKSTRSSSVLSSGRPPTSIFRSPKSPHAITSKTAIVSDEEHGHLVLQELSGVTIGLTHRQ